MRGRRPPNAVIALLFFVAFYQMLIERCKHLRTEPNVDAVACVQIKLVLSERNVIIRFTRVSYGKRCFLIENLKCTQLHLELLFGDVFFTNLT